MTDIDTTNLRTLAAAATPGPWEADYNTPFSDDFTGIFHAGEKRYIILADRHYAEDHEFNTADAEYIAAVSPDVLLALMAERDALARKLDAVRPLARASRDPAVNAKRLWSIKHIVDADDKEGTN